MSVTYGLKDGAVQRCIKLNFEMYRPIADRTAGVNLNVDEAFSSRLSELWSTN